VFVERSRSENYWLGKEKEMAVVQVQCYNCKNTSSGKLSFGFVGLRTYCCPECKKEHAFGLSSFTEKLYIGFLLLILAAVFTGVVQSVGVLLIVVVYALYKNHKITTAPETAKIIGP
jgi:hypothetical protein